MIFEGMKRKVYVGEKFSAIPPEPIIKLPATPRYGEKMRLIRPSGHITTKNMNLTIN